MCLLTWTVEWSTPGAEAACELTLWTVGYGDDRILGYKGEASCLPKGELRVFECNLSALKFEQNPRPSMTHTSGR